VQKIVLTVTCLVAATVAACASSDGGSSLPNAGPGALASGGTGSTLAAAGAPSTNETRTGGAGSAGAASSEGLGGGGSPSGGDAPGGGAAGASSAGTAGAGGSGGHAGTGGGAGTSSGSAGTTGAGGSAGTSGGATPDCNSITGVKVITVASSGSADFNTVQAAVNSVAKTNATPIQIRIAPGTYKEKLSIASSFITLCGEAGKATSTILTYSDSASTPNGSGGTLGTTGSASTSISSSDVSAENITFANSTSDGGGQAVALIVSGDRVQFRNCRFLSYQDTLYVRKVRQYFKDCYVEGSVDYIFGDATAVFDDCTVNSADGGVSVTAPNTDQAVPYGLVFLGGQLTASAQVPAGSVALGRNWGAYGSTTYLHTVLGAHISPVGWQAMGTNTLDTARFSEYKTSGAGATAAEIAARASQSKQLSSSQAASYVIADIFGSWTPTFSE
jgi:pectin methylesterase-like acyl-CoA thioesterase